MKRTFIAVKTDPGEEFKNAILNLKSQLRDENIRWADPGNLHVTLAFIGDTEESLVKRIASMLQNKFAGFGEIEFSFTGFGLFRNINNPRIIFSAIENSEKLELAHKIIRTGLTSLDITLEEREFNPHLTIGRIKDLTDKNNLKKIVDRYAGSNLQNETVTEIIYYESVLLPAGPVYKPISRVSLKPPSL